MFPSEADTSTIPLRIDVEDNQLNTSSASILKRNHAISSQTVQGKPSKPMLFRKPTREMNSSPSNNLNKKHLMRGLSSHFGLEEERMANSLHNNPEINKKIKLMCGELKDKVKETYVRNLRQGKSKKMNSMVEKFGNTLIASIFEALVLKAADDIQSKPIEGELNLSTK